MTFGEFLVRLMGDVGVTNAQLARLTKRSPRLITTWRERELPPRGDALAVLADAFGVPLPEFRDAATGAKPLPKQYRDRERWKSLGLLDAAHLDAGAVPAARVLKWFEGAPAAVQQAVLEQVPAGMEEDYLRHVVEYFRGQIVKKPARARPAAVAR